ncbi:MAG: hypothetical protein A2493_02710 [Candidatus Magasanikbacteria bacterium RIFOXYC12_FULL_33_11]|uniref:EamA domain-containing protein n=1 Tax=Candidatus Magasanikbacteria bacterium RIFOXYC12_FULL_33_11 TaxID=1798701 RepID=A0A1F6NMB2_9BACT|nr:MAG: hypothetical protein A2493_02710 [Candidatus Magasanikbacteria bacterium RIFOXYC12_FULL_33_11]
MNPKILFWILVSTGAVLEIIGDIFFKKWSIENKSILIWIGFLVYFAGTVFWAFSLKYEVLSKSISIFTILNLVILTLVGVIFFKEDISFLSKIGILLGIVSIIFIELG